MIQPMHESSSFWHRAMVFTRFPTFVAVVVVGSLASGPLGSRPCAASQSGVQKPSVQERLSRVGKELFATADRVEAHIQELKKILAEDPGSAQAHMLLGIAYRMQGSPDLIGESAAELRQALALDPQFVPARYYLARVYLDMGRAERARDELQTALEQQPGNPQFTALLGDVERQLKNPSRAEQLIRQALKTDEASAEARYYLGLVLLDLGRRDEAIRELERVAQSGARRPELFASLGAAYIDAGRLDEALAALTEGARLDPSRPDLRILLSRAYRGKGLLDKAAEQLAKGLPAGPGGQSSAYQRHQQLEFDFQVEKGRLALARRQFAAAQEAFKQVLTMDPDYGPLHRDLAELYLLMGSYKLAATHAAQAEKLGSPLPPEKRKQLDQKLQTPGAGK
jgi:tetratricopeptide (TPR) repeat protein